MTEEINTPSEMEAPQETPSSDIPDIAKLHAENAKWRTKLRAAEAKAKELEERLAMVSNTPPTDPTPSPSPDLVSDLKAQVEQIQAELEAQKKETLRQALANEFGLTPTAASLLPVDNPEKARQLAEQLKAEGYTPKPTLPSLGATNPAGQSAPTNRLIDIIKGQQNPTEGPARFGQGSFRTTTKE